MTSQDFNLFLSFLVYKGWGEVLQRMRLSAMNHTEGILNVGEKIPYVEEVTRSYYNTGTTTGTQTGTTTYYPQVDVKFGEALSGIELKIKPILLKQLSSIYADIAVKVNDVAKLVEIKAGQDTYSRPQTVEREIRNRVTLKLGEVFMFGGFTYEGRGKKDSYLPLSLKRQGKSTRLFFAVRPLATFWVLSGS